MHLQLFVVVISALIGLSQSFHLFNIAKTTKTAKVAPLSDFKIKQQVVDWVGKIFNVDFKGNSASFSWEKCGSESDSVSVTSLSFNPSKPKIGEVITITMDGRVNEIFSEAAEGTITLYFNGEEVDSTSMSVCKLVDIAFPDTPCPPPKTGSFVISDSQEIEYLPEANGRVTVIFRGNHGNKQLFCFGVNIDLSMEDEVK